MQFSLLLSNKPLLFLFGQLCCLIPFLFFRTRPYISKSKCRILYSLCIALLIGSTFFSKTLFFFYKALLFCRNTLLSGLFFYKALLFCRNTLMFSLFFYKALLFCRNTLLSGLFFYKALLFCRNTLLSGRFFYKALLFCRNSIFKLHLVMKWAIFQ